MNELFGALKQGLVDKNKNVLKTCLNLITKITKALGPGAKQFTKEVMTTVLQTLVDKDKLVWNCTLETIETWK